VNELTRRKPAGFFCREIAAAWQKPVDAGKRLVIKI
jgi:hypothetical protein